MGFKSWNINDLAISLNAVPLDDGGYGDDEVMTVEWNADQYEDFLGADGEVTRSETNDFRATVTLRFAQTAAGNDRLTALLQADLLTKNGAGAGVFLARDKEGSLIITAERAWVMGMPPVKAGKTVQVVEWKIRLANARASFIGGR